MSPTVWRRSCQQRLPAQPWGFLRGQDSAVACKCRRRERVFGLWSHRSDGRRVGQVAVGSV